jgi:hypothetical protein
LAERRLGVELDPKNDIKKSVETLKGALQLK